MELVIVFYVSISCYTGWLAPTVVRCEMDRQDRLQELEPWTRTALLLVVTGLAALLWPVVHMLDLHDKVKVIEGLETDDE